ncbi:MAG: hypothetical protein V4793_06625 [Paraburkholderia tropica]|uniref:Phage tail assembly chaperone n=1 Tax=Paraburkholderia tropica TaxID=92647 RepID=A0ABX5MLJ4_9BURK|nr:hypothetical protein [Paraburkholderia tropica]PXX14527.1 hypothetical protein C7400_112139 [Paraburkholderia tropica]PZW79592.1 hypothetical protein C7399_112138 [Paraburkholderia tropica]
MSLITKEQFLSLAEPATQVVTIKGVGDVRIKVMDGFARDALQKALQDLGTSDSVYFSAVIIATVIDENGEPLFTPEELAVLRAKNAAFIQKVGLECVRVNALGDAQTKDAEKNSDAIQSNSSGTA